MQQMDVCCIFYVLAMGHTQHYSYIVFRLGFCSGDLLSWLRSPWLKLFLGSS